MIELAGKDIKMAVINILHMLQSMMRREIEDIKMHKWKLYS